MDEIRTFIENNVWLCLGVGVVAFIVLDEVFGFTRKTLGDDDDDLPATPKARAKQEEEWVDPMDQQMEEGEPTVDDVLFPPGDDANRRR